MYQIGIGPGIQNHSPVRLSLCVRILFAYELGKSIQLPGTKIAGHSNRPAEGGFLYKPTSQPSYYYFFFSNGITPVTGNKTRPAAGDEYKVVMGRGMNVEGPFYDESGNDLTKNTTVGTVLLASHDNIYAPGGSLRKLFYWVNSVLT
jgi:arabinan endo-1,5-alpha-L-arabinosidase